jgi:hypothetical protein
MEPKVAGLNIWISPQPSHCMSHAPSGTGQSSGPWYSRQVPSHSLSISYLSVVLLLLKAV